jgi:hypothetical protein
MLEQLLELIQQQGQQQVVQNPAIPNEHNSAVLSEAGNSIMNGLQQALAGGGLSHVMSLFSGNGSSGNNLAGMMNNPVVQNIVQSFMGKLTGQFQVNPVQAQQVSNNLIPQVLQGLAGRVSDPNDTSIDINSVMHSLTGGQSGGIDFQGLMQKFQGQGGDVDGDGDTDLQDIIAKVSSGAQQSSGTGGGVLDIVKGLFN